MIRNNFDGIIEDIAKVGGEAIKELVLQLAPNEELSRALKLLISITTQRYCFVNIPVSRIRQALTETVPCA